MTDRATDDLDFFDVDDVASVILETYQNQAARQLQADLLTARTHHTSPFALLLSPTGSGKTYTIRVMTQNLWVMPDTLNQVVVGVPQNQIKDSWCSEVKVDFQRLTPNELQEPHRLGRHQWVLSDTATEKALHAHLTGPATKKALVTSHSALRSFPQHRLPKDCSKMLLIFDEGHHLGETTDAGSFAKEWLKRGGSLLLCTAALLRSQGDVKVPPEVVAVIRTLAEHIAAGCAPKKIYFVSKVLNNTVAVSLDELLDSKEAQGFQGSWDDQAAQIALYWKEALRMAKYIHLVRSGQSRHDAEILVEAFVKLGVERERIFNAVGADSTTRRTFRRALIDENNRCRRGEPSQYDIMIASRRFDEATDWAVATHMGCHGFPDFIGVLLQRLGRLMRLKLGKLGPDGNVIRQPLPDYRPGTRYEPFGDEAHMTFFLPADSAGAWDKLWASQRHRELVHMIAALAADLHLAEDYLALVRDRANDKNRSRPSAAAHNKATWERIAAVAGMTVEMFKTRYAQAKEAAHHLKGFMNPFVQVQEAALHLGPAANPSDKDLHQFLTHRMGLKADEATDAIRVKNIRRNMGNPRVLSSLDAKITLGLIGPQTSKTLILQHMQDTFDECVAEIDKDNTHLFQVATDTLRCLSEITGTDPPLIAQKLRAALPEEQLTPQEVEAAILDAPSRPKCTNDRIEGYKITWRKLDKQMRAWKPNTTLEAMVFDLLGPENAQGLRSSLPQAPGGKMGVLYTTLSDHQWHLIQDLATTADVPLHNITMWVRQLRREPHRLAIEYDKPKAAYRLRPGSDVGKSQSQQDFEQAFKVNLPLFDQFVQACVTRTGTFSAREVASSFSGNTNWSFWARCARLVVALVPALKGRLQTATLQDTFIIDWTALGIDPLDPKWDDYQVRAGGALPRVMPLQVKADSPKEPFKGLLKAVFEVVNTGRWFTCKEITQEIGRRTPDPKWSAHPSMSFEESIAARMRDLRKPQFGGYTVECVPTADGNIENRRYRLHMPQEPDGTPATPVTTAPLPPIPEQDHSELFAFFDEPPAPRSLKK